MAIYRNDTTWRSVSERENEIIRQRATIYGLNVELRALRMKNMAAQKEIPDRYSTIAAMKDELAALKEDVADRESTIESMYDEYLKLRRAAEGSAAMNAEVITLSDTAEQSKKESANKTQ